MKRLLILMSLFLVLFSFSVLAERYVEYEFREAYFDPNGNFIETTKAVDNVSIIGFVCANGDDCSDVLGPFFNGDILNSGPNSNEITLVYPTQPQFAGNNGYGVYKYKDEENGISYIPWESNPTWHGTDSSDPQGPYINYLTRVQGCSAPIEQFTVINDAQAHIPLVIGVDASLDAVTYAALNEAGPLDYVPDSLLEHYSVRTLVSLTIQKENGEIVFEESREFLIPFGDDEVEVEFTWTPEDDGRYEATAVTDVIDGKCISSISQQVAKEFNVLEEFPRGMCYTLLNNMDLSKEFPREGEREVVTVEKISNHADNETTVTLTPIATDFEFTVIREEDGVVVHQEDRLVGRNSNPFNTKKVGFNWRIPTDIVSGLYTLAITGIGSSSMCNNVENLVETISTTVFVRGDELPDNQAPIITSDPREIAVEGLGYMYDVEAIDPDGDSLTFSLLIGPAGMTIKGDTGLVEWVPKKSDIGQHNVVVSVSDGFLEDSQSYILVVADEDSDAGERLRPHEFSISNMILSDYMVNAGDHLELYVGITNRGRRSERVRVEAVILEIGEFFSPPRIINLGKVEKNWLVLDLDIPDDLQKGHYIVRVRAANSKFGDDRFDSFEVV